jgi:flagellar biosynthesis/type III secretory pathway protein FliH
MTAGQRLIQQGYQEGFEQGYQEGFEQGYQEGLELARQRYREIMLRWLRQRFGDAVDPQVEQRIATAPFEELETWSARVVTAATLAD